MKAKVKEQDLRVKVKTNNKGIHSTSKSSQNKNSKNYKKVYQGQGR
jgi:hypothetical protein